MNVERSWDKLNIQASKEENEVKRTLELFQLQSMHGYPYFILKHLFFSP